MGILMCGLNGAGKSTLGRALAERAGFHFIDNEDLYFPRTDPAYLYAAPRRRDEVERLLLEEIRAHEHFVFASVRGDYQEDVRLLFDYVVLLEVPREVRLSRVRDRSFRKFGGRMLPRGDLYQREEEFFALVRSRPEDMVEEWIKTMACPVIRVDGTRPVEENVERLFAEIWRTNEGIGTEQPRVRRRGK